MRIVSPSSALAFSRNRTTKPFTELRKHSRKVADTPSLHSGLDLGAAPPGRHLLEAIDYLCVVQSRCTRAGPSPTAFAPNL